jgi:peptidoglycan/LPS O-acetylase OafA/YrhL
VTIPHHKATFLSGRGHVSFVHLDMMRGLAALFVFAGHLRSFVFQPYVELAKPGPLDTVVWAFTGFGHEAVVIFFVLSGFFITRSIVLDDQLGRFSWPVYGIKRLSRLWIVLIPCLILTFIWDSLGISLSGRIFYDGQLYGMYNSGPHLVTGGVDLSLSAFVKNVFFLQTIIAPTFGSNYPLWSLANEFWYYLMFPLLYLSVTQRPRSLLAGAINLGLFVAACLFVGEGIVLGGIIWLAGAVAYLVYARGFLAAKLGTSFSLILSSFALLIALAASRMHYHIGFIQDCLIGLATATLVLALSRRETKNKSYRAVARSVADASYTIYLAHFPFLALLAGIVLRNQQLPNSAMGYAMFSALGAATLVYCYAVYWMFERNTAEFRRYCLSKFGLAPGVAVRGVSSYRRQ